MGENARPFMFFFCFFFLFVFVCVCVCVCVSFFFFFFAVIVACDQALHLGDILKSSCARGTQKEIRVLSRLASLAQIGELARRLP